MSLRNQFSNSKLGEYDICGRFTQDIISHSYTLKKISIYILPSYNRTILNISI